MLARPLGIGGLLLLFADVWALIHVAQSNVSPAKKAIWILLILLLPVAGFILWLVLGPRAQRG